MFFILNNARAGTARLLRPDPSPMTSAWLHLKIRSRKPSTSPRMLSANTMRLVEIVEIPRPCFFSKFLKLYPFFRRLLVVLPLLRSIWSVPSPVLKPQRGNKPPTPCILHPNTARALESSRLLPHLYAWACMPFTYCMFLFTRPTNHQRRCDV